MAIKVLHNTFNMCIHNLLDMNALSLVPAALGPQAYISDQIPHAHVTTIT